MTTRKPTAEKVGDALHSQQPKRIPEGVARPEDHIYVYKDLVEVPPEWRTMRGGALNLHDINEIMRRAHEMALWSVDDKGNAIHFIPAYGHAQEEFATTHHVQNGVWVPKAKA